MSERRARSPEPGWLGTAGGALLLVVVGFAVGLVAGAAFEEPDLVFHQLAGHGERIAVDAVEEVELARSPAIPSVSAETREPEEPPSALPAVEAAPPPGPSAPLRGAGFAIQVGAFDEASGARTLARWLREKGLPGFVVEAASSPWRVRVGPYASEAEARRVAERLRSEHELPTWVLAVGGS